MNAMRVYPAAMLAVMLLVFVVIAGCGGGGIAPVGPPASSGSGTGAAAQKIYLTDADNNRILRMDDITGTNLAVFNGQVNGSNLNGPRQVWVDSGNRIYVADRGNNRIVRIDDMTGANPAWYQPGGGDALSLPQGVAVDGTGRIYIADSGNDRIVRVDDMAGTNRTEYTGPIATPFNHPLQMRFDAAGATLYVCDNNNDRVGAITNLAGAAGTWTWAGDYTEGGLDPSSVVVHPTTGQIYIGTDVVKALLIRIDNLAGANRTTFAGGGGADPTFLSPVGVALDSTGRIYAVDSNRNYLARFDDMTGANWASYSTGISFPMSVFIK